MLETKETKPECFGDPDYYDPTDKLCNTECSFYTACGIRSSRSGDAARRYIQNRVQNTPSATPAATPYVPQRTTNTPATVVDKTKIATIVEDCQETDTFTSILMHNASLEALQAIVDELGNSIKQIPRKSYTNLYKRKKE